MERKVGNNRVGWKGSGCPQEGRFQESEMQFGSRRAAGPSDGGLGEAGGGPWTHASSVRAEGEGGQGGLGEGSWGEGGTRTAAACASEARGLLGRGAAGPKTPICSLCEASSFTVQMRSFQGHVCTGPAGVRVRECVRVRVSVYDWGCCCRGRPQVLPPAPLPALALARSSHPRVFRPPRPRPGIFTRPRPAPTLRRHHHRHRRRRRPGSHGPRRGQGGARHDVPPLAPPGPPRGGVPPKWHSPHPRRPSQIRWHPAPPATGGRRRIAAQRSPARPPDHPSARPRGPPGSPAPPGRGGPGAGGRGGGPGRARLPFSAAAAEPARGPAPAPSPAPCGPRREPIIPGRGPRPPAPRPQAPGGAPGRGQGPEGGGGQAGAPAAAPSRAPRPRPAVEGAPRGIV